MTEPLPRPCPECEDLSVPAVGRRDFLRAVGAGAAVAAAGAPALRAASETKTPKPAEALILELYSSLKDEQKKAIAVPLDHGGKTPTRLATYNSADRNQKIGDNYTKAQQELIEQIVKSVVSGEEGYRRISRNGTWDGSGAFANCGCHLFGEPGEGKQYAWLFTGHHLTIRCDGNPS